MPAGALVGELLSSHEGAEQGVVADGVEEGARQARRARRGRPRGVVVTVIGLARSAGFLLTLVVRYKGGLGPGAGVAIGLGRVVGILFHVGRGVSHSARSGLQGDQASLYEHIPPSGAPPDCQMTAARPPHAGACPTWEWQGLARLRRLPVRRTRLGAKLSQLESMDASRLRSISSGSMPLGWGAAQASAWGRLWARPSRSRFFAAMSGPKKEDSIVDMDGWLV